MTDLKPGSTESETYFALGMAAAIVAADPIFAWPLTVLGAVIYLARQTAKVLIARQTEGGAE